MKRLFLLLVCISLYVQTFGWGFYAHEKITFYAVFLLPRSMFPYFKSNILYLSRHATDPDKRRYVIKEEGPRHYIDMDRYGTYPFDLLPRKWGEASEKYGSDSLEAHGILPWWIQTMLYRLTQAFIKKDCAQALKLSAEIGHYIADAHVPLHTSSNHNGQFTGQHGIHGFWESRIPELLAEPGWDFIIPKAEYIHDPLRYSWKIVLQSAAAVDSVLRVEKSLSVKFPPDKKYAYEPRNGMLVRQYSRSFTINYDLLLNNMVERRMRESIHAVASFWFTAWVNAGQPKLEECMGLDLKNDLPVDTTTIIDDH